ncbi:hypothetical protein GC175_17065 [bacterium]|nr:hypothetical protein [bacterium]
MIQALQDYQGHLLDDRHFLRAGQVVDFLSSDQEEALVEAGLAQQVVVSEHALEEADFALVSGIGEKMAQRLTDAGLITWQDLIDADPEALAAALPRTSGEQVKEWQTQAMEFTRG